MIDGDLSEFDVSRETVERLRRFAKLFGKWAPSINLVAPSTRDDVLRRHIGDSLELARLAPGDRKWIDLGTGGGFPGLITAIVLAEAGHGWVDLVESNNKKAAFLRAAILETGARAVVHPIRIEVAAETLRDHDTVSARALAKLDSLLGLAAPWLVEGKAEAWFHKGRDYRREVEQARGSWRFDLLEHPSGIEPDSVILQIRNLERQ
jgi:16S rRNA (guanine527-N7)-methyltransferase